MHIYNTLTRKKELLRALDDKRIGFYACGPTVYFYAHIGNMRTFITEDVLRRVLVFYGYEVKHVMNITDVGHNMGDGDIGEDKIRAEARKEHRSPVEIADFYTKKFFDEESQLNIIKPDVVCKASDHIDSMLELIEELDEKGLIYKAETGMYFDTSKSADYGKLAGTTFSRMNRELRGGARVQRPQGLRNITDFAVWRFASHEEKEMVWDTKYGRGFPGWHVECSAMSMKYLGRQIDIHAGGTDHIPVHHTNEIAQSEGVTGTKFVRYWVHGAFITVDGKKMSKSIGNIYTIEDLVKKGYLPLSFRYLCLTVHYRSMFNFTFDELKRAQISLKSLYAFVSRTSAVKADADLGINADLSIKIKSVRAAFLECIYDDINVPVAMTKIHELRNAARSMKLSKADAELIIKTFLDFDMVLGLDFAKHLTTSLPKEAAELIEAREKERSARNFAASDSIRNRLRKDFGITVEDTEEGTIWYASTL